MIGQIEKWALVADLVQKMRDAGGWAGQTHIQKTMFFLQELLEVPSGYNFVLYKHGPYSFDLRNDLGRLRANLALDIELQRPYGASFKLGDIGNNVINSGAPTVDQYDNELQFVVDALAKKDVRELERLGTALLVKGRHPNCDEAFLANKIVELKPHITTTLAIEAVRAVAEIKGKAKAEGLIE
jgi:uncharacterized protein YwgA